jgi:group I intron endonuclease
VRWIVYETRCLVNGKNYVGVHRQDEDGFDGYLGSGRALRRAIKKHGAENFVRRTLEEFSVEAEAYAREAEIVTEEFCKRRDTYNVKPGGFGGWPDNTGRKTSPETIEKMRQANTGKKHSPEAIEKIRQARLGSKHSPEAREKIREANLRRWANHRNSAA